MVKHCLKTLNIVSSLHNVKCENYHEMSLPLSPGCVVRDDLVHAADVDGVLGRALVVAHAGVLEPVAPQDLIGQVRGADLALEIYIYVSTDIALPARYFLSLVLFPPK